MYRVASSEWEERMRSPTSRFKRGVVTGILLMGALNGLLLLAVPRTIVMTTTLKAIAAINIIVCVSIAALCYLVEIRAPDSGVHLQSGSRGADSERS